MKVADFFKIINIDEHSATPKYLQLSTAIIEAIEQGLLDNNDVLPSINELSCAFEISRDTAERAYRYLKHMGIVLSVPGRGFYVNYTEIKRRINVCLLFNKLSAHKKIIYDSFVATLGKDAVIDFYIYNNDFSIFKSLILGKNTAYSHYVIISHFIEGGEDAHKIINTIPAEKLILLDKKIPGVSAGYSAVYENFEKDIYNALIQAKQQLRKYDTIKLIFPKKSYFPSEIIVGFKKFCQQFNFNSLIVSDLTWESISSGEVYITLEEEDLVVLIEKITKLNLIVGEDVGLISYNETPLKKLLLNGITTISTDFMMMGTIAAEIIKSQQHQDKEAPFYLTLRPSL